MGVKESRKSLEVLTLDKYEIASNFFEGFNTYEPFLRSILENRSAGKVITDGINHPSFVLVCTPLTVSSVASPNACAYLAGEPDQDSLKQVVSYLKTYSKVSLVSSLDWEFIPYFEKEGFHSVARLQFRRPFNLEIQKRSLPSQYSIKPMNKENFIRCKWRSFVLSRYGDEDFFFANAMGFCLEDQGKIVSEAYGCIADGKAEVGVITDEKYRGQNLGTIISAAVLEYCYENNIEPIWSCDANNLASAATAKKLGFQEDCRYLFLKWESI